LNKSTNTLTVTAVIVVVYGVLIALYAYLNRPRTVLLIVVMGVLV
jgi:multidrug efflux pump subunit AcrB